MISKCMSFSLLSTNSRCPITWISHINSTTTKYIQHLSSLSSLLLFPVGSLWFQPTRLLKFLLIKRLFFSHLTSIYKLICIVDHNLSTSPAHILSTSPFLLSLAYSIVDQVWDIIDFRKNESSKWYPCTQLSPFVFENKQWQKKWTPQNPWTVTSKSLIINNQMWLVIKLKINLLCFLRLFMCCFQTIPRFISYFNLNDIFTILLCLWCSYLCQEWTSSPQLCSASASALFSICKSLLYSRALSHAISFKNILKVSHSH